MLRSVIRRLRRTSHATHAPVAGSRLEGPWMLGNRRAEVHRSPIPEPGRLQNNHVLRQELVEAVLHLEALEDLGGVLRRPEVLEGHEEAAFRGPEARRHRRLPVLQKCQTARVRPGGPHAVREALPSKRLRRRHGGIRKRRSRRRWWRRERPLGPLGRSLATLRSSSNGKCAELNRKRSPMALAPAHSADDKAVCSGASYRASVPRTRARAHREAPGPKRKEPPR